MCLGAAVLVFSTFLPASIGDGEWLTRVPEKYRVQRNPYKKNSDAVVAGSKLFRQHCAECHGTRGQGRDPRLNLLYSGRIKKATPGQLEWLLTNGSKKNGMPSWSGLPESERWQIVSFLKTLE